MSLAILPGSYDPLTMGHRSLICQALERYDEVVVAVMVNSQKRTLFSMEERVEIAKRSLSDLSSVRVIADTGMLIDLYDRLGADAVCKGWRNETDLAYEREMAEWNHAHNPRFQTVLLKAEDAYGEVSSTLVRDRLMKGESIDALLHPEAIAYLREMGRFLIP